MTDKEIAINIYSQVFVDIDELGDSASLFVPISDSTETPVEKT